MKKRLLACLLTAAMLVSLFPLPALAAEPDSGGLCPHHTEHSFEICGYIEAAEGQPCGHVHDGDCGFAEAVPEVLCDMDCGETGEDSQIVHAEGCAYAPEVEGAPCQHEHGSECGYVPAAPGQPSGYVCRICPVQAMIDALSEAVTEDNAGDVKAQLEAIDKAKAQLSDEELNGLDFSRYQAAVDALAALDGQTGNDLPMPTAEGEANIEESPVTINACQGACPGHLIIGTGTKTANAITVNSGEHNITIENVNIEAADRRTAFDIKSGATVHLTLKENNSLKSGRYQAGLQVPAGATLVITEESTGDLTATGGNCCAGIGGGGNITINGGTVTAYGGSEIMSGAGIGGGYYLNGSDFKSGGGNITINGGTVNAYGGEDGAGIGGGYGGAGGNITIKGGTVNAYGYDGAGIGGGCYGAGGTIEISGGTVAATGRSGAGIGDGRNGTGGTFSTTESGTAIITATPNISGTDNQSDWRGVIFNGDTGIVGGNQTLRDDLTLTDKQTLTIPDGSTLTVPNGKTLTNNGTLIDNGTLNNNGTLDNNKTLTIDGTLNNNGTLNNQGTIDGNGKATPKLRQPDTQEGEGYSIDYATKKITIETDYTVEGFTTGDTIEPGTQIKCYKPENNLFEASKAAVFTTPALRNAPTVSINYNRESLNVTERGDIECSLDGTDWQEFGWWSDFDGFGWNDGATEIKVYVRLKATGSDYASNPTELITIPARPAAPDVKGVAPTTAENKDGKITGTAPGMEWDGGECTGSEITGLTPDTYYVWVSATDKSFASKPVKVEVPSYENATKYQVTVNNGKGNYTEAAEGWTVTVTANAAPDGQQFKNWTVTPDTVTVPDTSTASFIMPGEEVTLTANFEKKSTTHHVTVQNDGNGTASAAPASAIAGTKITLSATANNGYHFQKWEVISNNVTISSDNSFTMPDANVTVKAIFEKDSDPPQPTEYTVTFDGNGGTSPAAQTTKGGKLASLPTSTQSGYSFNGWYTAKAGGDKITLDTVFTASMTVYAQWTKNSSGGGSSGGGTTTTPIQKPSVEDSTGGSTTVTPVRPGETATIRPKPDAGYEVDEITVTDKNGKPVEVTAKPDGTYTFKQPNGKVTIKVTYKRIETPWNNPFTDVSENDWYYEAVRFVQERGLMNGYSDGRFGPNDTLSRAQLAQILFNKEGKPVVNYLLDFSDVAGEAWYTEAIRWAASQGIVGGYGNGKFGPNDPITREQLAVMLWRYSGSPAATSKELHFNDTDEINGFALEALRWAVENGILNGYGDGRLGPQGQATRAQVAQMLKNFIENQNDNI